MATQVSQLVTNSNSNAVHRQNENYAVYHHQQQPIVNDVNHQPQLHQLSSENFAVNYQHQQNYQRAPQQQYQRQPSQKHEHQQKKAAKSAA